PQLAPASAKRVDILRRFVFAVTAVSTCAASGNEVLAPAGSEARADRAGPTCRALLDGGNASMDSCDFEDAERKFDEALALAAQQNGIESPEAAEAFEALGGVYHWRGRYTEGENAFRWAAA